MKNFKQFQEERKCPPGYKYDKKLKTCVARIKNVGRYGFFGMRSYSDQEEKNGNGNGNGNGNNGNGNGGNGNGNGGNGGGNGGGGE